MRRFTSSEPSFSPSTPSPLCKAWGSHFSCCGDGQANDASSNNPLVADCRGASQTKIAFDLHLGRVANGTSCPWLLFVLVKPANWWCRLRSSCLFGRGWGVLVDVPSPPRYFILPPLCVHLCREIQFRILLLTTWLLLLLMLCCRWHRCLPEMEHFLTENGVPLLCFKLPPHLGSWQLYGWQEPYRLHDM
jgi:hypothetical protein